MELVRARRLGGDDRGVLCQPLAIDQAAGGALEAAGARPRALTPRIALPAIAAGGALTVIVYANTLDTLGMVTSGVIAAGLGTTAFALLRGTRDGRTWLIFGLGARAALGAFEGVAYAADVLAKLQPNPSNFLSYAGTLLAVHTSLDTGAEWLVALGCVMAVSQRMQGQMRQANARLLEAQEGLRRLVDRDPLTTLANRRTLPEVFRRVQPSGALLLFFDLDGFKQINDRHGHAAGDECLKRFAAALSESFRPGDAVIRYAGDEFLVVAAGLDEPGAAVRIESLSARMLTEEAGALPVRFSWGASLLAPGGRPDMALRAADESMYRAKAGVAV
jgi:diguanylate cyclase (GGDEF)-like protein